MGPRRRRSVLVQGAGEVEVVRRIYDEYTSGRSQMAIARALNADGIPTSTGAKWIQASVRNVLENPIYAGNIRHKGAVYAGAHEGIVSDETWDAARRVRESAAKSPNNGGGRRPTGSHLFTRGLLRCGVCGDALAPRTDPRRSGDAAEVYKCLGRYKDKDSCDQPPIPRTAIDEAMLTELTARYIDLEATRERLMASRAAEDALAAENLATAERDLSRAEESLTRVRADYKAGAIDAAEWRDLRAELEEERDAAKAAAERARSRTGETSEVTDELLDRLRDLRAVVLGELDRAPDLDALRKLLSQLFRCVYYIRSDDPIVERWGFDADDSLPDGSYLMPSLVGEETVRVPLDLARTSDVGAWAGSRQRRARAPAHDRGSCSTRSASALGTPTPARRCVGTHRHRAGRAGPGRERPRRTG